MANKKVSLGKVLGNVAKSTEKASKKTTTKKKDDEKKKTVAKQEKQTSVQKASTDAYKNYLESKKTTNATQTAESKGATKSKANGRVVAGKTIVKNKAAESRSDKRASNSNLVGKNYGTTASQEKENKRKSQANAIKSMYDDPVKLRNATVKDNGSQGSTYGMTKKEAEDTVKYWKSLDANAKNRIINKMTKDTNWKNVDKAIDKEKKTTKITKEDFDSNQSLIMQNATRMNGVARNAVLNSDLYRDSVTGKTLSQMAAEQNAYNYAKGGISVASQEFLNATSPLMNNLTDGYEYTQAQKDAIQKGKDSTAGKIGYMTGIGATTLVSGVTGMEAAMGKMLYKQGGKSAVKRWMANRGADMIINSGIDMADSVKSATDVDGNLDLGQAAKNMLVNEAMNLGVGGAMDTIGVGLKSVQVKRALQIKNKLNKGIELDASELKLLAKINQNQLDDGYYFYNKAMADTQAEVLNNAKPKIDRGTELNNIELQAQARANARTKETGFDTLDQATQSVQTATKNADSLNRAMESANADIGTGIKKAEQPKVGEMAEETVGEVAEATKPKQRNVKSKKAQKKAEKRAAQEQAKQDAIAQKELDAQAKRERIDAENQQQPKDRMIADEKQSNAAQGEVDRKVTQYGNRQNKNRIKELKAEVTRLEKKLATAEYKIKNAKTRADRTHAKVEALNLRKKITATKGAIDELQYRVDNAEIVAKKDMPTNGTPNVEKAKNQPPRKPKAETNAKANGDTTTTRADIETLKKESKELNDLVEKYNAETDPTKRAELKKELDTKWKASVERGSKAGDELRDAIRKENITTPEEEIRRIINEKEPKSEKVEETPKSEQTKVEETPRVETKADDTASEKDFGKMDKKQKTQDAIKKVEKKYGKVTGTSADAMYQKYKAGESLDKIAESDSDISNTFVRIAKQLIDTVDDTGKAIDVIKEMIEDGGANKTIKKKIKEAVADAEAKVEKGLDQAYDDIMRIDPKKYDPYAYRAETAEVLNGLARKFNETGDITYLEKFKKLSEHNIKSASDAGHALNACKLLLRETPEGRVRLAHTELKRLQKKYASRIKGELKFTDDEVARFLKAETPEEIDEAFSSANKRIWSQEIPATKMEMINEWRHFSMLANPRTQIRNFVGNGIFFLARGISDSIEYGLAKGANKMLRSSAEKKGKKNAQQLIAGTFVTPKDFADNKDFLEKQWNSWYESSKKQSRYRDATSTASDPMLTMSRPDGLNAFSLNGTEKGVVKAGKKAISKAVDVDYAALELGDKMFLMHEYKRSFIQYCKSKGIPMDGKATKDQLRSASNYAAHQAKVATYRDDSIVSDKLIKLKDTTATYRGKGKYAMRGANMALESVVPFVKTPVNVFRRMMDYSPVGLGYSTQNLIRFAKNGDIGSLSLGIHYMATGLTGTGVTVLGGYLAHKGIMMVHAGEVSGDEYYDRDMGYQDYSIEWNGKTYSLDWMAPIAEPLFMGATIYKTLWEDGFQPDDIFDCMSAITNPMLEMSFMSSAKDMVETFIEQSYDRATGEMHYGDAMFNLVGNSIPQGFLSSLTSPQALSQIATATDEYQRDTSSTSDSMFVKSWETWFKKAQSKIPYVRSLGIPQLGIEGLKPKLDSRGDVETMGDNIFTKYMYAALCPMTVKNVRYDKYDKALIDIYNSMPTGTKAEKNNKQFFFYNLTGNPTYDLANGERMTYDEKYLYTKTKRGQQMELIKEMVDSPTYDVMTPSMKASEIGDYHWITTTTADREIYGDEYAANKILNKVYKEGDAIDKVKNVATVAFGGDASSTELREQEAYDSIMVGKTTQAEIDAANKKFVDFYLGKEKIVAQSHDSSYYTKALAAQLYQQEHPDDKDTNTMALAYNIYDSKMQTAKEYLDAGGSAEEYIEASRRIAAGLEVGGATNSQRNKAVSAGMQKEGVINERTYRAMGIDSDHANMGVGLAQKFNHKYTLGELNRLNAQLKMQYNVDKNSSLSKEEVTAFVKSLNPETQEEAACLYRYFYTYNSSKNPFGKIPNFLGGEDTSSGSGGSGRRGWGRRRGHGGGGSKGSVTNDYSKWLKDHTTSTSSTSKTSKSTLTEAFRKQQLKKLQNTTGTYKA